MFHCSLLRRLPGTATIVLVAILFPLGATAQDLPSYAQPTVVSTDETIHGRIASVDGAFAIRVSDDRGFVDNVVLHAGTIINPTGLSLSAGMSVTIAGYNAGSVFEANEIDTPYSYSGELPTPVFYGPGYWCPGFAYGYGPSFSLAFIIGGGYDRFEHRPFYGRPWNGHHYFGDYVGRRDSLRGFIGERRAPRPEINGRPDRPGSGDSNVPHAFVGRSFAGRPPDTAAGAASGVPSRFAGTSRGFAEPRTRYAPNPAGPAPQRFPSISSPRVDRAPIRIAPAPAGGFARSAPARVEPVRAGTPGGALTRGGGPVMRGSGTMMHGGGVHR